MSTSASWGAQRRARARARAGLDPLGRGDEHDEQTEYEQAMARRRQRIAQGLIRILDLEAWREQAACRGESADLFFGFTGEPWELTVAREQDTKRTFCDRCPVRVECRESARAGREYGLWGGENEADRALVGREPIEYQNRQVQRVRAALREGSQE